VIRRTRRAALGAASALWLPGVTYGAAPSTAYIPSDSYPERYHQKWALSCEYAAAHTALYLLGHVVSEDIMRALLGSGEDPDETFRGEIQANQTLTNYGVHARGIARMIELLRAGRQIPTAVTARLLYDIDDVHAAIATGHPVVAWIPLDLRDSSRVPVRLSTGKVVNLVPAEHAVTLRGYDGDAFYALDPHAGTQRRYDSAALWRGMSLFDDPALSIGPTESVLGAVDAPPPASVPAPVAVSEFFPDTGITLEGGFYRAYLDSGARDALGVPITPELTEVDPASGHFKQVLYTEAGRLEWLPDSREFALGFAGQELLAESAQPDPARRLAGAIGQYVAAHGGSARDGSSLSEEVLVSPDSDLLPRPADRATGQWFQTGLLVWLNDTGVTWGRVGYALAKQRGYVG